MNNLAIAIAAGLGVFLAGWAAFGVLAGILPGLLVFVVVQFLLGRRASTAIGAEVAPVQPLLQQRKIDEAIAVLRGVQARWGRWQFLIHGQIEAQLGILDYLQMKFDEARPKLAAGGEGPFAWTAFGRNATALAMLACIDYRQGRKDDAWSAFQRAGEASGTDVIVYQIWATLLSREGKRPEALLAVSKGLASHEKNASLQDLQARLANDKKIDPKEFGDAWYQFFPEDLLKQQVMTGRKGGTPNGLPQRPQQQAPRHGARHAPRR